MRNDGRQPRTEFGEIDNRSIYFGAFDECLERASGSHDRFAFAILVPQHGRHRRLFGQARVYFEDSDIVSHEILV